MTVRSEGGHCASQASLVSNAVYIEADRKPVCCCLACSPTIEKPLSMLCECFEFIGQKFIGYYRICQQDKILPLKEQNVPPSDMYFVVAQIQL